MYYKLCVCVLCSFRARDTRVYFVGVYYISARFWSTETCHTTIYCTFIIMVPNG